MLALILAVPALLAAQPRITNARLETRAVSGLENELRRLMSGAAAPAWAGYQVASVERSGGCCNGPNGEYACALEPGRASERTQPSTVKLEPTREIMVLLRLDQGQIQKIRTFSIDCEVDAGGLTVYWLTGVQTAESIRFLSGVASEPALAAVAQHADPAADTALERFAAAGQPERLRRAAIFWMGASRGQRGFENLRRIVDSDPEPKIREHGIFGLSVSKVPGAVDGILAAARNDPTSHVRAQALFWAAQKAAKQALPAVQDAIERDPDTEVKKRAVFALSRMDDGVPRLIEVARNHRNTEVRRQAMFWLGQSKDARALDFFEQVLRK